MGNTPAPVQFLDEPGAILEACKNGHLSAFEKLYGSMGERMKSIALNLLGNVSDAEDAVQDAFLKVYRNIGEFKGRSALSTWVYRILVNTCYDAMRKRKRRQETVEFDLNSGDFRQPAVESSNLPLRLTLERHLKGLSTRHRTVFLLFESEGFKHSEIAEILHVREGTSKVLLFEAKRELRKMIWITNEGGRKKVES